MNKDKTEKDDPLNKFESKVRFLVWTLFLFACHLFPIFLFSFLSPYKEAEKFWTLFVILELVFVVLNFVIIPFYILGVEEKQTEKQTNQ